MKYGMNALLWTTDPTAQEFLAVLEQIKAAGYDGVELPIFGADVAGFAKLGKELDRIGLERTAVTVRSADDDPMSSDVETRKRGVKATNAVLDCCEAVGAQMLVGPYHSALGHFSGAAATPEQWNWAVESMRQVAEHAAARNVVLAVECLNRFETYLLNNVASTVQFIRDVNHPACRMMYDTFHAHIEEKNIAEAIRASAEYLVHVHISENDRSTPGRGQVNWNVTFNTLKEIGYDGWLMVEAFGLALPELAAATRIWRKMYDTEDQLMRDAVNFMKMEWEGRTVPRRINV